MEKQQMPTGDTSPEAESIQIDLLRKAPTWKRLRVAAEMSETIMLLSRIGVARRNPGASPAELRRLAAEAILGPELAFRVYGR
ncbi:MAG: hypothetical protein NTU62_19215 [Spirochaetes bacterium]|nr:hypothetical protein [Spirochaetota bacterium]